MCKFMANNNTAFQLISKDKLFDASLAVILRNVSVLPRPRKAILFCQKKYYRLIFFLGWTVITTLIFFLFPRFFLSFSKAKALGRRLLFFKIITKLQKYFSMPFLLLLLSTRFSKYSQITGFAWPLCTKNYVFSFYFYSKESNIPTDINEGFWKI